MGLSDILNAKKLREENEQIKENDHSRNAD